MQNKGITLRETCKAIWLALKEQYLNVPSTTSNWLRIAKEFEDEWNFLNYIGAIDRKHIMMGCSKNGGSAYFNCKSFHCIVLLGICDAKYCFTFADIGGFGSTNDASELSNSGDGYTLASGRSCQSIHQETFLKTCQQQDVRKIVLGTLTARSAA